jgi:hypothetical protein
MIRSIVGAAVLALSLVFAAPTAQASEVSGDSVSISQNVPGKRAGKHHRGGKKHGKKHGKKKHGKKNKKHGNKRGSRRGHRAPAI